MEAWEHCRQRADSSLDAAEFLQQRGYYCSAASRAYYAAYQAATAILGDYIWRISPVFRLLAYRK